MEEQNNKKKLSLDFLKKKFIPFHNSNLSHLACYTEYSDLIIEFNILRTQSLQSLFLENASRCENFRLTVADIELDYSLQRINKKAIYDFTKLAEKCHIHERIDDLFSGKYVNRNENKPALHTALRAEETESIHVLGENVTLNIQATLEKMEYIAHQLRNHEWQGYSGQPITDVVNIGIGGSGLGPQMAVHALKKYKTTSIRCHFILDCDPSSFEDALEGLNPETTVFIIASKSFTTYETLLNLRKAMQWLGTLNDHTKHFIAITANPENVKKFAIKHILTIGDWIGGRFSFFSAMNLIVMISIGPTHFRQLLLGGRLMDKHFKSAPLRENMPVLLALMGMWNINFFGANNHLLLIYSNRLQYLVPFLQQLDMESNGKSTNYLGEKINYITAPIIWGGLGNHAEHAFYQLLYQGSHYIPGDYIFLGEESHHIMNATASKKLDILAFGLDTQEQSAQVGINKLTLKELNPTTLGALVALYEHKIYCQSIVWHINPFDQPGVDAAKKLNLNEI